jgi:TonB family protein
LYLTLHQSVQHVKGSVSFLFDDGMSHAIHNPSLNANVLEFASLFDLAFRLTITNGRMTGVAMHDGHTARVTLTGPVVTFPVVLRRVDANYTDEAQRLGNEGTVVLLVRVDRTGRATALNVLQARGSGLDEQAMEVVKKWSFKPATDHGKPVAMETTVEVPFHLPRAMPKPRPPA